MKSKKRIFVSLLIIAALGAAAYGAVTAYLTARRTTSANKFTVGTLDLDVSANGNKLEPFVIENMGENANISGSKTWTVKNTGTLPGRLLVRLQGVTNEENGCNDQEKDIEPNCEADANGELGNVITANVSLDGDDQVSSTLATAQQSKIGQDWNALTPIIIAAGETKTVGINWATEESAYGNEVQSDSVTFDVNFRLIQLINGPTPVNE